MQWQGPVGLSFHDMYCQCVVEVYETGKECRMWQTLATPHGNLPVNLHELKATPAKPVQHVCMLNPVLQWRNKSSSVAVVAERLTGCVRSAPSPHGL